MILKCTTVLCKFYFKIFYLYIIWDFYLQQQSLQQQGQLQQPGQQHQQQRLLSQLEQQLPVQLQQQQALSARGSAVAAPRVAAATTSDVGPALAHLDPSLSSPVISPMKSGLGAAFFCVLNALFFCVLLTLITPAIVPKGCTLLKLV